MVKVISNFANKKFVNKSEDDVHNRNENSNDVYESLGLSLTQMVFAAEIITTNQLFNIATNQLFKNIGMCFTKALIHSNSRI